MSRPFKDGLDYFELDCQLDDKIKLIQAEFGLKGFAIVVKLFQKIYGGLGYYCEWNADTVLLFTSENGLDREASEFIQNVVRACIRRELFSEALFERYQILTSAGIQKRYLNAVSKRKGVTLKKEYLLVNVDFNSINAVINSINAVNNPVNSVINSQSREEKSREEKSRVEERRVEESRGKKRVAEPPPDYAAMIAERGFSFDMDSILNEFLLYKKKEKKFTYKEIGFKNLLDEVQEKVNGYGDAAVISLIRMAMANGYQGIPWDRLSQNRSRNDRIANRVSEVDNWLK